MRREEIGLMIVDAAIRGTINLQSTIIHLAILYGHGRCKLREEYGCSVSRYVALVHYRYGSERDIVFVVEAFGGGCGAAVGGFGAG